MKHCLIIDRSPIIRKVAAVILSDLGYRAEEAENEMVALAHCRIEMPDMIFIDWKLPNDGAPSFLELLRGLTRLRKPRILVWTTCNDEEALRQATYAGADEQILKPFDRRALMQALGQSSVAA